MKSLIFILVLIFSKTVFAQTIEPEKQNIDNRSEKTTNTLHDPRDGKNYKIVQIGSQIWMAENLAYRANNGCWTFDNIEKNAAKYGYLYNWETAQNVCPSGWHLPSDSEWEQLPEYISKQNSLFTKSEDDWKEMGKSLKTTTDWINNGNGTDDYGFSALPAGFRGEKEVFFGINQICNWWSNSTLENSTYARIRYLYYFNSLFGRYYDDKTHANSVRCIKDN